MSSGQDDDEEQNIPHLVVITSFILNISIMPRALSAVSSLEIKNLVDDQIRFFHPGYPKPLNLLFCLPRVDYSPNDNVYGVHYLTALTACQIIANNAFEKGKLAKDDKGKHLVSDEEYLIERDYWFFVDDDGEPRPQRDDAELISEARYPIVPSFRDWEFPHDRLPSWWIPTCSQTVPSRRCAITNTIYASTHAQLIPREEHQWFNENGMGLYGGGSRTLDDQHNFLPLKADLYVCFDQRVFAMVPKPMRGPDGETSNRYVLHVFDGRESEFAALYQNRPVENLSSGSREYLFARFAWAVFSLIRPFLTSGVGRRITRFRIKASTEEDDEGSIQTEMQTIFLDAKKLGELYGGRGFRHRVSLGEDTDEDGWDGEHKGRTEMEG